MKLLFTKMHALGNDFMVIYNPESLSTSSDIPLWPISLWADRHRGIGFDQLLLVSPAKDADFFCRIYNADGSEAEQCGNGLRCVARYVCEAALTSHTKLRIATIAGIFPITCHQLNDISISLGIPTDIKSNISVTLATNEIIEGLSLVSMGNPHAILKIADLSSFPIETLGKTLSMHPYFPQGANIGFMQIDGPQRIQLRTVERGAGLTLACGSNACAAVVAGIVNGWLTSPVTVSFRYGNLIISWNGKDHPVKMMGPAEKVFSGEIEYSI